MARAVPPDSVCPIPVGSLMENAPNDRFKDAMGIMIGVVALVTALAAWRAGVASRVSGAEDYRALVAVLNTQETQTLNYASVYSHLTAFTQFVINDELLTQLLKTPRDTLRELQIEETDRLAATNRNFFPARYAGKDGTYDAPRELAEQFAEAERQQDLFSENHLAVSDAMDDKTYAFVQSIIYLSVALLFFTFASTLHSDRRFLRYAAAVAGFLILLFSIAQIIMTEWA